MALPFRNIFGSVEEVDSSENPASSAQSTPPPPPPANGKPPGAPASPFTVAAAPAPNSPFAVPQAPFAGPVQPAPLGGPKLPPPPPLEDGGAGPATGNQTEEVLRFEIEQVVAVLPADLASSLNPPAGPVLIPGASCVVEPDGWVRTRLVAVYRACPQLFSVPVSPELDGEIRIERGGMPVTAGADFREPSAPAPEAALPATPFSGAAGPGPGGPLGGMASPFRAASKGSPFGPPQGGEHEAAGGESPAGSVTSFEPGNASQAGSSEESGASKSNPFLKAGQGPSTGGSFSSPKSVAPSAAPASGEAASEGKKPDAEAPAPSKDPVLDFGIAALVKAMPEEQRDGLEPASWDAAWAAAIPLSFIQPQLAAGRVSVLAGKLAGFAREPEAARALEGAAADLEIPIPLQEIFRQLPSNLPSSKSAGGMASGTAGVEIRTPFSDKAKLDPGKPAVAAFPESTLKTEREFRDAPVRSFPGPDSVDGKMKEDKAGAGKLSLDELDSGPERALSAAAMPVKTVVGRPSVQEQALGGMYIGRCGDDVELRAVFSCDETFTPVLALEKTRGLPGIEGCVLFGRGDTCHAEVLPEDEEGKKLARQTPQIYQKIKGLAEDLGFGGSEAFTLKTNHGALSFFVHNEVCLSVLHREADFGPGMREKLVLISRGAAALVS